MSISVRTRESWTFRHILLIAFLARVFLIFYAKIHDYIFQVNFTDIDYRVFTDAAKLVVDGRSPYERPTYRYTPLLAWLLTPTVWIEDFGKFVFCSLDCLTGYLLYNLASFYIKRNQPSHSHAEQSESPETEHDEHINQIKLEKMRQNSNATSDVTQKHEEKSPSSAAFSVSVFWLFNPFVAIISARGNADSLVCCAVLFTLFLLERKNAALLAALVHGALAIHLKIYPLIYLPSIFLYLAYRDDKFVAVGKRQTDNNTNNKCHFSRMKHFLWMCINNQRGYIFVMLSILFFCVTIAIGYLIYHAKFFEEFFLYHVVRCDVRHNFSPYFYPLYLAGSADTTADGVFQDYGIWIKLLGFGAFLPQVVCIVSFAMKYYDDLPFCWFLTTFSFVTFNKVCTSQYFIWYLCFLPLIYDKINISRKKFLVLAFAWFGGQGVWLFFAYLFEFRGLNTLSYIWGASILFLLINCWIINVIICNYRRSAALSFANKTIHETTEETIKLKLQ